MQQWNYIDKHISACLDRNFNSHRHLRLQGGCISSAWLIGDDYSAFFVKLNSADKLSMFTAEAEGLSALRMANAIKVPEPVCYGDDQQQSFLVTEYLELNGQAPAGRLGEQLACLHQTRQNRFGWHRDNTIGSTTQINTPSDNWIDFWRQYRLGYQLLLAQQNGYSDQLQQAGDLLMERLPAFFNGYQPQACLLHGDLWSGNVSAAGGEPVIFDPAVYYGDREADLAMTELFGGFDQDFYTAYNAVWPLDPGYKVRKHLYNLYHLLNHLNLFGSAYHRQCLHTAEKLLAETQ